jgi:hypothetical protein
LIKRPHAWAVTALAAVTLAACTRGPAVPSRTHLETAYLAGTELASSPFPYSAYQPHGPWRPAVRQMRGHLSLAAPVRAGRVTAHTDLWQSALDPALQLETLPVFSIDLVQDGEDVIPVQRGSQQSDHPYWEFIPEPGKAWRETADGDQDRVALPFALQERNQNCTHNGVLTFLLGPDGAVSRAAYQVVSETCLYLKADLWGLVDLHYVPNDVAAADDVVRGFRTEVAQRLPVRPVEALSAVYPGTDAGAFIPLEDGDTTVFGFVIDGVHYRGDCATRFGSYPFCDVLDLPSYSLAKSVFSGLSFLYLEQSHPGFSQTPVTDLIPECRLADGRWDGVTLWHLLNMVSGNFDSPGYEADEGSLKTIDGFFLPESHVDKVTFGCGAHPRRAEPGEQFAYHTSDTYLLGVAMNAHLRRYRSPDSDVFVDVFIDRIVRPLQLSPVAMTTRRTYDAVRAPFAGYGLTWHPDDIARLAAWLVRLAQQGESGPLHAPGLAAAMFRAPGRIRAPVGSPGEAYSNGFWGVDAASWIGCEHPVWIPFMSGYGGINVVLLPNGSVYYDFEDGDRYRFREAVVASHQIRSLCEES